MGVFSRGASFRAVNVLDHDIFRRCTSFNIDYAAVKATDRFGDFEDRATTRLEPLLTATFPRKARLSGKQRDTRAWEISFICVDDVKICM